MPRHCPELTLDLKRRSDVLYEDQPEWARRHAQDLVGSLTGHLPRPWHALADLVRLRTRGRFDPEIRAIARWVGVSWRRAMLGNVAPELALGRIAARPAPVVGVPGCSTLLLATPSGPVMARNMDFWPPELLARTSTLLRYRDAAGDRFLIAGWPGSVAVTTALSARGGFALATNALPFSGRVNPLGWPVLLCMRRILEDARSFEHALDLVLEARLAGPVAVILCGTRNDQRVVIEKTPARSALRRPDAPDAPLIATNHCLVLPRPRSIPHWFRTSAPRYDRLQELADGVRNPDDAGLLAMLTDPAVRQPFSAQHIIIRPAERTLLLWAA